MFRGKIFYFLRTGNKSTPIQDKSEMIESEYFVLVDIVIENNKG